MSHMVAVHLYGPLADEFGAEHRFAINTPIEAVHALDANFPGFLPAFVKFGEYHIIADDDQRDDITIAYPVSREVHIAPVIEGRAFIGAALLTALIPGISASAASIFGGLLMAGLMMGLSMLLTPKPKTNEDTKKDENYAFTGPENVTGQGVAVPLIYGRVFAGSVVVSAGLDLGTDLAATNTTAAPPAGSGSSAVQPGLPTYPGGFPAIVDGAPVGWNPTSSMNVTEGGVVKHVTIYQPSIQPNPDYYYAWNNRQGFYSLAKVTVTDDEWIDGGASDR